MLMLITINNKVESNARGFRSCGGVRGEWRVGKRNARNYARTLKAIAMEQKRTRKKECLAEGKQWEWGTRIGE